MSGTVGPISANSVSARRPPASQPRSSWNPFFWLRNQLGLKMAIVVVGVVAFLPVAILLVLSFYDQQVLSRPGALTISNYVSLASQRSTWVALGNTVIFMAGGAAIAVALGTVMAFAVTNVKIPFPNVMRLLPLGTLLIPALLKDSSWLMLFEQHSGLVNTWLRAWVGSDTLISVSTLPGLTIAAGVFMSPTAYVVMLAPLGALDRSYLEASNVAGARTWRTLLHIVLPMVRPAIISAAILATLTIASSFETPIILGSPGRIVTYMTLIYNTVSGAALHLNTAATQSVFYLIVTSIVLVFYMRATRNERRFVVVQGKGNRSARIESRPLSIGLTIVILLQGLLGFIGPIAITVVVSFLPFFTTTAGNPFTRWTLKNYRTVLADPTVQGSILTSTALALATVVGALVVGLVISYAALKSGLRHSRLNELVGMAPLAVPPTVYSVGLLLAVLSTPAIARVLYGSIWVMFIASVVAFLPLVTRLLTSALIQIQDDLLHASTLSGASRWTTVRRIVVPLLRPAIASAAAVVFLQSYRELGAIVLLVSTNTNLVPFIIFSYLRGGNFTDVAALNMLSLIVPVLLGLLALGLGASRTRSRTRARGLLSAVSQ